MKRTPIVLAGTVVGLAGVLTFHSTPAPITLGLGAASPQTTNPPAGGSTNTTATTPSTAPSTNVTSSAPTPTAGNHSATGKSVNFYFASISVKVSTNGSHITKVGVSSLKSNDGANQTSQYIDQQALPMLEQEVLKAQSSNIQGVSGASYTSSGFYQSLQSALSKLGLK